MEFLDFKGLSEFLTGLLNKFATKESVNDAVQDIDTYALNVDYSSIEFDTSEIV